MREGYYQKLRLLFGTRLLESHQMAEKIPIKVVIENAVLKSSRDDFDWQRVATVYIRSDEYRVMAPTKASGHALDWRDHLIVRHIGSQGYTDVTKDMFGILALRETEVELIARRNVENRPARMNPDGMHYDAFICLHGHILNSSVGGYDGKFCDKCGLQIIADCPHCKTPIRGQFVNSRVMHYTAPNFCHDCGRPYPWMEDRLKTARALLDNDDHLKLEDRERLWGLLQYVMSSPKADLAPAKRKLIEIGLGKAAQATKELVMEFMAKYAAEMSK